MGNGRIAARGESQSQRRHYSVRARNPDSAEAQTTPVRKRQPVRQRDQPVHQQRRMRVLSFQRVGFCDGDREYDKKSGMEMDRKSGGSALGVRSGGRVRGDRSASSCRGVRRTHADTRRRWILRRAPLRDSCAHTPTRFPRPCASHVGERSHASHYLVCRAKQAKQHRSRSPPHPLQMQTLLQNTPNRYRSQFDA